MTSIEAYHIVTGCFYQFLVLSNKVYPKYMNINSNHSNKKDDLKKSNKNICESLNIHFLSSITIIFSLNAFSVVTLSFHDQDGESNPRTNYTREILKRVISPG